MVREIYSYEPEYNDSLFRSSNEKKSVWSKLTKLQLIAWVFSVIFGALIFLDQYSSSYSGNPTYISYLKPQPPKLSPREILLKENGVRYTQKNFWLALNRGDQKETILFLEEGMPIDRLKFHNSLANDELASKLPFKTLLANVRPSDQKFCLSDDGAAIAKKPMVEHRTVLRFISYIKAGGERSAAFLKAYCPTEDIVRSLTIHLNAEKSKINKLEKANVINNQKNKQCVERLIPREVRYRLFPKITKETAVYPKYCIQKIIRNKTEANFCNWVMFGKNVRDNWPYNSTLKRFCRNKYPLKSIDRKLHDSINGTISVLSK